MKKVGYSLLICVLFLMGTLGVHAEERYLLKVNTEGLGQIEVVAESEEIKFSDEYPFQSVAESAVKGTKFNVGAKADDGWKFVKWTLDGADYSEEEMITVEVNSDMDLIAVFESGDDSELVTDATDPELTTDTDDSELTTGITSDNSELTDDVATNETIDEQEPRKDAYIEIYLCIGSILLLSVVALLTLPKKKPNKN